jgi:hypothetical protein
MLTRRDALCAAIVALAAAGGAAAADAAARAFLVAIYNTYKGKGGNGIQLASDAVIRRYFEPGLAALMIKDQKEAGARGEVGALDGDPFVDAQDWDIKSFEIGVQDSGPSKATGTVTFENFDKPVTVVLALVKVKGTWRIADITWQREGQATTLRSLYAPG